MATCGLYYATTYFEKIILDKITGCPNYPKLHTLLQDLKANASKVPSKLGGGMLGHLGLLLSAVAYARISVTAYV